MKIMIPSSSIFLFLSLRNTAKYTTSYILSNLITKTNTINNNNRIISPNAFTHLHEKQAYCPKQKYTTKPFFSVVDDNTTNETNQKTIESTWDIKGLKKEVSRAVLRSHKKIQKASLRYRKAEEEIQSLLQKEDATMEELENCPNSKEHKIELEILQDRLKKLLILEEGLIKIKKNSMVLPEELASLAIELDVNDAPPVRPKPVKKKKNKDPKVSRKPYKRYYSVDGTEIRVGKQAEDNDELSISPQHRSSRNWWMHASGCPGSHVVIRIDDENLPTEVINDAAALAARQSKCTGGVIKVSLTRCRNVSKPPGAKPGLVYLNGDIKIVKVNMNEAKKRLERLDKTVLVN